MKQKISDSVTALDKNPACAGISPPQECIDHFYVMQAHHDHCLHDQLPMDIEKKLHTYEHFYTDCVVKRQFDTNLEKCPSVDCEDAGSLTNAISTLQNGDCGTTAKCATTACAGAVKTVLMAHDVCPEDKLPNNLETALHDFEDVCAAQLCNSQSTAVFDAYSQTCKNDGNNDVDGGFGLQDSVLVLAWALLLFMLSQ